MGEVCKFYELADTINNRQEECLTEYETNPRPFIEAAGFRYPAFLMSLIAPVCFIFIEFMQNQLLLEWKHLIYQYIFTGGYALVTMLW